MILQQISRSQGPSEQDGHQLSKTPRFLIKNLRTPSGVVRLPDIADSLKKTGPENRARLSSLRETGLILVGLLAFNRRKDALAQADTLRRDLDEFVVLNVLERFLERKGDRRGELDRFIGAR